MTMKNTLDRRVAAMLTTLCLSACAHNPVQPAAATPGATPGPQTGAATNLAATLPPDVLVACQRSAAETTAGHLDDAARLTSQCLTSHSLPVAVRALLLQQLAFLDMARHDDRGALDAQLAALDLTPKPSDAQLIVLAHLYQTNHRNEESLATLTPLDAPHVIDPALRASYYLEVGAALAALGRHQDALDAFGKGIAANPYLAEPYRKRAAEREASGDAAGARADYQQFAGWALDAQIDAPTRAKLASLGIDPAEQRRHPFGSVNPLHDMLAGLLEQSRQQLKSATTTAAKAEAYSSISAFTDNLGEHAEALTAIDKAIALAPDNIDYRQSKVTTLLSSNRADDALKEAAPLRRQAHAEAAAAAAPFTIYQKYGEVSGTAAMAYIQQGRWSEAIDALTDRAKGADADDRDYMATMYLYVRAKSAGAAPASPYFDDYIRRTAPTANATYRRGLLLYMQGKLPIDVVYSQVTSLGNPVQIQNGLAETWFVAAAYERYVKHDDAAAHAYVGRLNDLQPYGTMEWTMARRGGA
ncbi:hypothetical protein BX591_105135 [Paraburkholderia bryophila]|uniref:Tetratricopeptide repeat protein n=2 Tax=Paraburkholderia bryophila TaxID=420952 RepID=A0A329CKJ5_9BURK|nr:hypothetical protein BX591_105135 [Paraburkholderia bryophila]